MRRAYQLVAACLTGAPLSEFDQSYCRALDAVEPGAALALHLEDFKRFALAVSWIAGRDLSFTRPYPARLPFSLPGTPLTIGGDDPMTIRGLSGRAFLGSRDGERPHPVPTETWPTAEIGEARITLDPVAFLLPGFGFYRGLDGLPAAFQAAHRDVFREVLRLIERFDSISSGHVATMLRVVAFKPAPNGDFANLSHSELPGAVVLSVSPDPYIMAAGLIHEIHHHRLYCIEELGPFFDSAGPDPLRDADYYSPWREDLRPLHGILHGVYVFIPVLRFWWKVLAAEDIGGERLDFVRQRLVSLSAQLRIGIAQLRRYARFTDFGAALFEEMCREVDRLAVGSAHPELTPDLPVMILDERGAYSTAHDPSTGGPMTVRERLLRHRREHDVHGQCSDSHAA